MKMSLWNVMRRRIPMPVSDDIKVGISLIFYLRNRIPYIKAQSTGKLPIRGTTLTLSGLSLTGSILLPIKKDEEQVLRVKKDSANRTNFWQLPDRETKMLLRP